MTGPSTSGAADAARTAPAPQAATEVSRLDRRREKLQSTKAVAESATAAVGALDERLDTDSAQRREHEAALQAALVWVA